MTDHAAEPEEQIQHVLVQLLPPLRVNKEIRKDQWNRLIELLEEAGRLARGSGVISKSLAYKLFY